MTSMKETSRMMMSDYYKERFIAEYWQTKIRYNNLKRFNIRIQASLLSEYNRILEPKHDCPLELLMEQEEAMRQYLKILEIRSVIEGVDLSANNMSEVNHE